MLQSISLCRSLFLPRGGENRIAFKLELDWLTGRASTAFIFGAPTAGVGDSVDTADFTWYTARLLRSADTPEEATPLLRGVVC